MIFARTPFGPPATDRTTDRQSAQADLNRAGNYSPIEIGLFGRSAGRRPTPTRAGRRRPTEGLRPQRVTLVTA